MTKLKQLFVYLITLKRVSRYALLQFFFLPFIEIQVKICFIGPFINMTARLIKSIVRNDFFIRSALQLIFLLVSLVILHFFNTLPPNYPSEKQNL